MGKLVLTYADFGNEKSVVVFPGSDLTAGNIADEFTQMNALVAAVETISLGQLQTVQRVASVSPQSSEPSDDPLCQREKKWLVRYHDSITGEKAQLEIPCADLMLLDSQAREFMDQTSPAYTAFEQAFIAYVVAPGGNAPVLDSIQFVARNL